MRRRVATLAGVIRRMQALAVVVALCAVASACGPEGPVEEGGDAVDPVAVLTILPSPGELRGEPAEAVGEAALQEAFTGAPDPELVEVLEGRGMRAAAVRTWSTPDGQELVTAVSVWESSLLATGIGGQAAEMLLTTPGARAWTPQGLRGTRGARVETGEAQERRLSYAVGPNNVFVRSVGPVEEEIVTRAAERIIRFVQANPQ